MPKLTFVQGRAGSGKSRYLHKRIGELIASGAEVVLIVPEQFTFETERELSLELPGLMDAAVFSFTTLAKRVLDECGERTVFLSRQGRRMMIRREADSLKQELEAFAPVVERPGFSQKCDELISLFKRFDITPEALTVASQNAGDGALKGKLSDLARIYSAVCARCAEGLMDSDDALNALRERLPESSLLGKHIIIDGFDMLTEQIYLVIGGLMQIAAGMYISIRSACGGRDAPVFAAEERAHLRLMDMARSGGMTVAHVDMPGPACV